MTLPRTFDTPTLGQTRPFHHVQCHPACAALVTQFATFQHEVRGLARSTIEARCSTVARFIAAALQHACSPDAVRALQPTVVHAYVIEMAAKMTRAQRIILTTTLRSFLRFAHIVGYLPSTMVEAVPTIRTWAHERVPKGLAWKDVERLLTVVDRTMPAGRRDYAMLLLMLTYGTRIGQVTRLRLVDIDWHRGQIRFPAFKRGKAVTVPLHPRVAEAILAYVPDRHAWPAPEVFLTSTGPRRPFGTHSPWQNVLAKYFDRAGITSSHGGAHRIRHTVATRLLSEGTPIKAIADLYGHRSMATTYIYTKVDVERLRTIAAAWPVALASLVCDAIDDVAAVPEGA